jgi:glycosyltransferase involved in cell wall biosynthesis
VRVLFALSTAHTDPLVGASRSLATLASLLASAGVDVRVVCTSAYDLGTLTAAQHLAALGIVVRRQEAPRERVKQDGKRVTVTHGLDALTFDFDGVPVRMSVVPHGWPAVPDERVDRDVVTAFQRELDAFHPDHVITWGHHAVAQEFLRRARVAGAVTHFSVRNAGFEDPRWFQVANGAFACSPWLSRYYAERIGLRSAGLFSPVRWADVVPAERQPLFLTLVNPSPRKGMVPFARLALMLGERRPDIPVLCVMSYQGEGGLNALPGVDFSRYPQMKALPPVPLPSQYLAVSRVMAVPSVFDDPFGRVAAEAMIAGVPVLVGDRGGLPETVAEGGTVLPLPSGLDVATTELPAEEAMAPWFEAVVRLWDDAAHYRDRVESGREVAEREYSEGVALGRHLDYLKSVTAADRCLG